jgi:exopolysaccharide biosynthesis polyprenyl glycosylphosphotransferase
MSSIAEKPNVDVETLLAGPVSIHAGKTAWRFEQIATAAEIAADGVAAATAICTAYWLYHLLGLGRHIAYPLPIVFVTAIIFAVLFVMMLDRDGAYRQGNGLLRIKETERTLRVSAQAFLVILPATIVAAHLISRWVVGLAFVIVPCVVISEKQIFFMLIRALHARGLGVQRVLIYGAGFTGKRVFSALVRSPKLGLDPVAMIDDDEEKTDTEIYSFGYRRERNIRVSTGPIDADAIRNYGADVIVVAIPTLQREKFAALVALAAETKTQLTFVPSRAISSDLWMNYADIDGIMLASFGSPMPKFIYEIAKRAFDSLASLAILTLAAPLLAAIALAVRLDSPGPVIFKQRRVGKDGKLFDIYKFRSMRADVPKYGYHPKQSQDPRITRVGRYLRKTSLDELPQLFNVLRGEMSLVGPRPEMPFIVEQYGLRERQRLSVVPGITGLWQLSADRESLIHENIQYDLYYIRNRGFFMDFAILLHTAVFAMKGI